MPTPNPKLMYGDALIGSGIQRDIGQTIIYRLRPGNGQYGSNLGEIYQDKYGYFVPSSITHVNGDSSRTCFAAAVAAWQGESAATKTWYDKLAQHYQYLSGYNLYIRQYMNQNYS